MAKYHAEQFIRAIPGTGGIISHIAERVGCVWTTAQKYITEYPTVAKAYKAELESITDLAESIVISNLRMQRRRQETEDHTVETSDARWFLSTKGRDRGYGDQQDINLSGGDGGPVVVRFISNVDDDAI